MVTWRTNQEISTWFTRLLHHALAKKFDLVCKTVFPHERLGLGTRLKPTLVFFFPPTGPAFTVIYVLAGLPLARLADTRSRPLVLIFGVVFWSIMVLLTGFVESFWQLLVLRIFLGIGEVCTMYI